MGNRFTDRKKKGTLANLQDKAKQKEQEVKVKNTTENSKNESSDKSDKIRRSYMLTQEQIGKLYQLKGMKYPDKSLSDIIGYLIENESLN